MSVDVTVVTAVVFSEIETEAVFPPPLLVIVGGSLEAPTVSVTVCVALAVVPSLATTVIERLLVVGASLVSLY